MTVITRFAPSPTGFLHIGGARTALFNWLYARHHGGQFLLRIEDTDRQRSTDAAIDAIFDGLDWLGLHADQKPVFQFDRRVRHAEVAHQLLAEGKAYRCWCTQDELVAMREKARAEKKPIRYDGTWRDRDPSEAPAGLDPVVRIKMPQTGETVIEDAVQGRVVVQNAELDDMVLLRADGTPTYMLSVVVDDHDMGVTHVIRGDDHLNNAFRQAQVFLAMGWDLPVFAHIPLIHGPDGAKLSKRHGALGVDAYRDMGCLPEAVRNYLLRLGWAHGDDEIISTEQAIQWFDLDAVGRSPARFDMDKLTALNAHYLRLRDDGELVDLIAPRLDAMGLAVDAAAQARLRQGMAGLKQRARKLDDLAESAAFYVASRPIPMDEKAAKLLDVDAFQRLRVYRDRLRADAPPFEEAALEAHARSVAESLGVGFGKLAQPLRAALTGRGVSPGLFEVMAVLGKAEVEGRLADVLG
ncbi:MAG: glutamate--tRNA ligase [Geminicoccaceae bacterium]|nr:MAG: glutamate--tRNA ligase [Geminicoccaceae bacterium]